MIVSKKELKSIIISEIKQIAKQEGWLNNFNSINECNCNDNKDLSIEDFEEVNPNENKEKENTSPEDVKKLAEEVNRMRQLLNFKSPILGGEK